MTDAAEALGVARSYEVIGGKTAHVPEATRERLAEILGGVEAEAPGPESEPGQAYTPDMLADGGKAWGVAVQLYALRSERNWGIGDLTDLAGVVRWAEGLGASYVGVNPLHALFLAEPARRSPYSPSSRLFLNPLYIDPEAAPGGRGTRDEFAGAVDAARAGDLVDYDAVAAAKRPALEAAHARWREAPEGEDRFGRYLAEEGEALRRHALFEALADDHTARGVPGGFLAWPEAYRDPDSAEALAFAEAHAGEVRFHQWLQWVAHEQLSAASTDRTTLYLDLAVGAAPDGSEVWSNPSAYVPSVKLGAPPDPMAMSGQDWGLTPMHPKVLEQGGFAALRAVLRASMRHAGALRIDHVLGYARQFWIPAGAGAADGGYVAFPRDGMIAATAEESRQDRCLVIGEDLGTVPEGLTEALQAADILSYYVARWARDEAGGFLAAEDYPRQCLAVTSTHDVAPVAGWLKGSDLDARAAIEPEGDQDARSEREAERAGLLALWGVDEDASPREAVAAAHRFMGRSSAAVVMVALEDLLLQERQVNMPGTTDEHPNWRVRYARDLGDWTRDEDVRALATEARR